MIPLWPMGVPIGCLMAIPPSVTMTDHVSDTVAVETNRAIVSSPPLGWIARARRKVLALGIRNRGSTTVDRLRESCSALGGQSSIGKLLSHNGMYQWHHLRARVTGPTSIQAIPLSSTSVLLSWGPLAPYVVGGQYRVRVRDNGNSQRFLNVGYVLSAIIQDLDPTENYTLSVQWCPSKNVCSDFVSTTRIASAPKIPVPSNLTVVAVGPSSINITWQLPSNSTNVTGYQVSWCLSDLCIGKLNDLTTKTFYSVQRLQDFKNYTVFVCAYVDQGLTPFVGQCINVSTKTQPGAPAGGVAIPLSQSSILVTWVAKPGCPSISAYNLRVASPTPTVNWASTELTQYTFANLMTKTKYTFQLRWCPLPGTCSEAVNITGSTV
ncbi:hypothetical protein HPB51_014355 [Rhipicephalus microplus]|uniref:Fibronectin type-III domain-containing protein n=1 Tax=Rhipicephalus microplus TaxID=6941 RepID=A0A9J6EH65_RHIMP|nr:hypothetical protein HPB51_014355 [Rhipicephalus microplus]